MNEPTDNLCEGCDHDLKVMDASFDHEYGVQKILYYECSVCGATHEEDRRIPSQVEEGEFQSE